MHINKTMLYWEQFTFIGTIMLSQDRTWNFKALTTSCKVCRVFHSYCSHWVLNILVPHWLGLTIYIWIIWFFWSNMSSYCCCCTGCTVVTQNEQTRTFYHFQAVALIYPFLISGKAAYKTQHLAQISSFCLFTFVYTLIPGYRGRTEEQER